MHDLPTIFSWSRGTTENRSDRFRSRVKTQIGHRGITFRGLSAVADRNGPGSLFWSQERLWLD